MSTEQSLLGEDRYRRVHDKSSSSTGDDQGERCASAAYLYVFCVNIINRPDRTAYTIEMSGSSLSRRMAAHLIVCNS